MSYLKIKKLHVTQGNFTLDVEDLEIEKGAIFGILGHSGAGKSTLLNLISGLLLQECGEVILDGKDISVKPPFERQIAYVFQNSLLFEHLNVRENLEYLLSAKGVKKSLHHEIVKKALKECEASELMNRNITTLSGGEKQRVALACALMFKPKLLILDEPFSNLDMALKIKMRAFLKSMIKKHSLTTLMVSHDSEDAFSMFDKIALLGKGKVVQIGLPKEIYENPNSLQSAEFFALENIFFGNIKDGIFSSRNFKIKLDKNDEENIIIHIPQRAINVNENGKKLKVKERLFSDGKWKITFENGVVIYSIEEICDAENILIDKNQVICLKDKKC